MNEYLTEEQTQRLREALRGHDLEAILTLALVTGMRRDELLQVKWQDIDLGKRELRVLNSKTKSGDRTIHVPEGVTEMLRQHRMRQGEARLEAGSAWQNLDLIFPNHVGGFLGPDLLLQGFHEILAQAKVPHIPFHDLRETHGRTLREQLRSAKEDDYSNGRKGDIE